MNLDSHHRGELLLEVVCTEFVAVVLGLLVADDVGVGVSDFVFLADGHRAKHPCNLGESQHAHLSV